MVCTMWPSNGTKVQIQLIQRLGIKTRHIRTPATCPNTPNILLRTPGAVSRVHAAAAAAVDAAESAAALELWQRQSSGASVLHINGV